MNPIIKNVLIFIAAFALGNICNYLVLTAFTFLIPPPEGIDTTTPEGIKAAIPLMETKHFIGPLAAHAIGTLVAGIMVGRYSAAGPKIMIAIVAALFLILGVVASLMIPAPQWFNILDLSLSYIPMAILGGWIGLKLRKE